MQQKLKSHLDNANLGNLHIKLKNLRDEFKYDKDSDIQSLHQKLKLSSHASEQSQNMPSRAYTQTFPRAIQTEKIQYKQHQQKASKVELVRLNAAEPQYFANCQFPEKQIDYEEVRRLASKKISADYWKEYQRFTLADEVYQKIQELCDQLQDIDQKVDSRDLIRRINKWSIKFSEAITHEIPIIKRRINLKKVIFELANNNLPVKITYPQFYEAISSYKHSQQPTIDKYINNLTVKGAKSKNYFNIPKEVVQELKNLYRRCSNQQFLTYIPIKSVLKKVGMSKFIQQNLHCIVRPKTNYEIEVTLADTLKYIQRKAPQFIDLDEFLLFFTAKGFSYYPIQQRYCLSDSTLTSEHSHKIAKIKSHKSHKAIHHYSQYQRHYINYKNNEEYVLSSNNPNSIRNNKLKEMIKQQQQREQKQQQFHFKARPMPKSISQQKYEDFMNGLNLKKQEKHQEQANKRKKAEMEVKRLEKNTKLFLSPTKRQPQYKYSQYRFMANPTPDYVHQKRLKEIEVEKIERKNKILSQTKFKYQNSWQQLPLVATVNYSPKKPIHTIKFKIPIKQIPDYKSLQAKTQRQLQQRKHQFHPTETEQFHFHTEERHPPNQHLHQYTFAPPEHNYDYKQIIYGPQPDIYYTQKFTDMVVANKKRILEKEKSLNKQLHQDVERKKKHQSFAKFMKHNLMKLPDTAKINEVQAKVKIDRHKKYWKNLDRQHENQLNQIYVKILKRPFLYEQQANYSKSKPLKTELPQKKEVDKQLKSKPNKKALKNKHKKSPLHYEQSSEQHQKQTNRSY